MVLDRRGFMKFIAGAGAGVMVTPIPWKLLDDVAIWTQNWPWIPSNIKGENRFTYSVSKLDPSGVPVKIRMVDDRPVRVLPAEGHPLGGGVTALAVAEVQMLHSPAKVKRPLRKAPDGSYLELTWPEAVKMLQDKLDAARAKTAFISGDENGSTNEVLGAMAKALGSEDVFLMPSEGQCAAKAAELMGMPVQLGYDLENSDYVFAIGANLLESWGTVVRNRRIFKDAQPHPRPDAVPSKTIAYAGPVQNNTAAVARPWLPIYPGTEGVLALGIANMLIAKGRTAAAADFGAFKALAASYTPEQTAQLTGVDPKKLEAVVDALLAAKAPLVIVGSEFSQGAGAAPVMAGFAVNTLLGNINKPGGVTLLPQPSVAMKNTFSRTEMYKKDVTEWLAGKAKPELLVLHDANPVYALPNPDGVKQALEGIPFKVSFSTFMDETAILCDLILPLGLGLERVDDLETPYGCGQTVYCVSTATTLPVDKGRSTGNALLYVSRELGMDLGFVLYEDILKAKALFHEKCSFDVLAAGQAAVNDVKVDVDGFSLRPDILEQALKGRSGKLGLAPYAKLNLGNANTGIPPYNTKTLRAKELDGKTMFVMMNKATASKNGVADGDMVVLESGQRRIPAGLRVFEGVMNDAIAVCLGYGHTALDAFSQNKGANVMELMTAAPEEGTGLSVWAQTGVTVVKA